MVTNSDTKRKRPRMANDGEQDPSKPNPNRPKGKLAVTVHSVNRGKKKRAAIMENGDRGTEDEDGDEIDEIDEKDKDSNDYDDDSRSQQQRMMLFEKRLKAIKQKKKSSFEKNTSWFQKRVQEQEETLIKFLQEQRLNIKNETSTFSKEFSALLNDAFESSFPGFLAGPSINPLDPIKDKLHAPNISITTLPTKLLASTRSLQDTLTTLSNYGLIIGDGWEQDGDLSISALRDTQQIALLKLTEAISKDGDAEAGVLKEGTAEISWKCTAKRSERGIKKLLKNVPVTEGE